MPVDPYFTPEEFKDFFPDDDEVQALTDEQIDSARATAEEIIERAANVAFVVREKTLTVSPGRSYWLPLGVNKIRSIEALAIDGDDQDVDGFDFDLNRIYWSSGWTAALRAVEVEITHGYDAPPLEIKEAAMTLTKHRAIKGPIDDRATSISAGEAGGTITLLTPGVRGVVTGIPSVDQAIQNYRIAKPRFAAVSMTDDGSNLLGEDPGEIGWH